MKRNGSPSKTPELTRILNSLTSDRHGSADQESGESNTQDSAHPGSITLRSQLFGNAHFPLKSPGPANGLPVGNKIHPKPETILVSDTRNILGALDVLLETRLHLAARNSHVEAGPRHITGVLAHERGIQCNGLFELDDVVETARRLIGQEASGLGPDAPSGALL